MAQFAKVSCKYGAPMGRSNHGGADDCAVRSVRLFKVRIDSGGYDNGGAYWGHGEPIYCATDDADYFATVRAISRDHAILLLRIPHEVLKIGLSKMPRWGRWSAQLVHAGRAAPSWEISEFSKVVGHVNGFDELCDFAESGELLC